MPHEIKDLAFHVSTDFYFILFVLFSNKGQPGWNAKWHPIDASAWYIDPGCSEVYAFCKIL